MAAYLLTRNVIRARLYLYTEICGGYVRKSSKFFYNSAPKVEQYYLQSFTCFSVFYLPLTCEHQIHISHLGSSYLFSLRQHNKHFDYYLIVRSRKPSTKLRFENRLPGPSTVYRRTTWSPSRPASTSTRSSASASRSSGSIRGRRSAICFLGYLIGRLVFPYSHLLKIRKILCRGFYDFKYGISLLQSSVPDP